MPLAHALRQKQAPRYRCVPVQPNKRPDKPWQRAARSCPRLRLSFRNTVHERPVLRWRTGSNAPCTVRGIKASISKNTSTPLFVFPPEGGLRKKLFYYLACSDWYSICCMCISWSDIYFGNTFGSILMHTLFPWVNIEQYSSCYTRYLFNIFFTLGNESLARTGTRVQRDRKNDFHFVVFRRGIRSLMRLRTWIIVLLYRALSTNNAEISRNKFYSMCKQRTVIVGILHVRGNSTYVESAKHRVN